TRARSLARARRDAAGRNPDETQARIARGDDDGARAAAAADGRNQACQRRRHGPRRARLANTTEGLPAGAGNHLRRHARVPSPVSPDTDRSPLSPHRPLKAPPGTRVHRERVTEYEQRSSRRGVKNPVAEPIGPPPDETASNKCDVEPASPSRPGATHS